MAPPAPVAPPPLPDLAPLPRTNVVVVLLLLFVLLLLLLLLVFTAESLAALGVVVVVDDVGGAPVLFFAFFAESSYIWVNGVIEWVSEYECGKKIQKKICCMKKKKFLISMKKAKLQSHNIPSSSPPSIDPSWSIGM